MPLLSLIAITEFSEVLTKLSNAFLNGTGEGNDFMSSFSYSILENRVGKMNY